MIDHSEIEIKLTGDIDKLHEIIKSSKLSPYIKSSYKKNYITYYYDTKDNRLIKNNIVLRKRVLAHNKNIFGLKWSKPKSSLFERGEFEVAADENDIDLKLFGEAWNHKLQDIIGSVNLEKKFSILIQREIYQLFSGDTQIEICLDKGKISTEDKVCQVNEIELELKSGNVSILYNLAINFIEKLNLSIELESKAERGYLLLDNNLRKYFYNISKDLDGLSDPELFITISVNVLIKQFSIQIKNLSDGYRAQDIHQARVLLRRLRVIFSALKKISNNSEFDILRGDARHIATLLGNVREYDVLEELVNATPREFINNEQDFDELISNIKTKKELSLENAKKIISEGAAAIFIIKVEKLINKSRYLNPMNDEMYNDVSLTIKKLSSIILDKVDSRVRKRGEKLKKLHDIDRHQLRIDLKKLRYLSDFFGPLYDKKILKEYIKHVSELQEYLGAHNDIVNAELVLRQVSNSLASSTQFTAGKILGWHICINMDSKKQLFKSWKRFVLIAPFWMTEDKKCVLENNE
jgi:inorganic triphosphatase YgiF